MTAVPGGVITPLQNPISPQPRRRFHIRAGRLTGSGLSANNEVSGRRVQSSRDSYECAQRFFSMAQRQSTENRHPHRCKMFAQQINDGERTGRLKFRELTDGNSCKAVEMPGLAEHRQSSIDLTHMHVNCFNEQNGSVQRWKSPPSSGRNHIEIAAQQDSFRHARCGQGGGHLRAS
jgi:hypothetical protein